jgi:hypothetical protein
MENTQLHHGLDGIKGSKTLLSLVAILAVEFQGHL